MTSGYIPPRDAPNPDEIFAALRDALADNRQPIPVTLNQRGMVLPSSEVHVH